MGHVTSWSIINNGDDEKDKYTVKFDRFCNERKIDRLTRIETKERFNLFLNHFTHFCTMHIRIKTLLKVREDNMKIRKMVVQF